MKTLPSCDHDECPQTRCLQTANAKGVGFSEIVLLLHGWRQIIREKRSEAINAKRMELNESIAEKATIEADTMEVCMKMLENRMQQNYRTERLEASND